MSNYSVEGIEQFSLLPSSPKINRVKESKVSEAEHCRIKQQKTRVSIL